MTRIRMVRWMLIAGLTLALPFPSAALKDEKGKPTSQRNETLSKKPLTIAHIVYKPPLGLGAPAGRVAGGTRGQSDLPVLAALTPDHVGLTTQAQPTLYWYLSQSTTVPIEFTVSAKWAVEPLLEMRLPRPSQPGIQRVRLGDYGIRLKPGVLYRWFVALVPDPTSRSTDIIAGGSIERTALPKKLQIHLAQIGEERAPSLYAEAGLWYDALTAISDLIDTAPEEGRWRQQRAALLEQVGLSAIAKYDVQQ